MGWRRGVWGKRARTWSEVPPRKSFSFSGRKGGKAVKKRALQCLSDGLAGKGKLMTNRKVRSRAARHSQTPIMVSQIRSLCVMASEASARATANTGVVSEADVLGDILASNMAAVFALELSIKVFYMSFKDDPPELIHELDKLWFGLPENWRMEIDRVYQSDRRRESNINVFAMKTSKNAPERPAGYTPRPMLSADGMFLSLSRDFIYSRYFYEHVDGEDWAYVEHPIHQMLAMIDVLGAFYEHLKSQS